MICAALAVYTLSRVKRQVPGFQPRYQHKAGNEMETGVNAGMHAVRNGLVKMNCILEMSLHVCLNISQSGPHKTYIC